MSDRVTCPRLPTLAQFPGLLPPVIRGPLRRYLKYNASAVRAANIGCSPQNSGRVHDYTVGIASGFPVTEESVKHSFPPLAIRGRS